MTRYEKVGLEPLQPAATVERTKPAHVARARPRLWPWLGICLVVFSGLGLSLRNLCAHAEEPTFASHVKRAATPLLNVFQVYPPVLTPTSQGLALTNGSSGFPAATHPGATSGCVAQQVLMDHVFAFSYGMPFVGMYILSASSPYRR